MYYCHVYAGVYDNFIETVLFWKNEVTNLNVLLATQVWWEKLRLHCVNSLTLIGVRLVGELGIVHRQFYLRNERDNQVLWGLRLICLLLKRIAHHLIEIFQSLVRVLRSIDYFLTAKVIIFLEVLLIMFDMGSEP